MAALEAVWSFSKPRFNCLLMGLDKEHRDVSEELITKGIGVSSQSIESLTGCVEIITAAVRKVLQKEAKLGDSFVDLGLDSMSSMALHHALCGSLNLPASIFYEHPTVLDLATFMFHQCKEGKEGKEDLDFNDFNDFNDLEGLLEDAEARRSYRLGQARAAKDPARAVELCLEAQQGAQGPALLTALALEAQIRKTLSQRTESQTESEIESETELVKVLRKLYESSIEICGDEDGDTSVALGKLLLETSDLELLKTFEHRRKLFLRSVTWVEAASLGSEPTRAMDFLQARNTLQTLNLDDQNLSEMNLELLGDLNHLEVLKMRRAGLQGLPSSIGKLSCLREMYLTSNALSDLPQSFSSLRLQVLCLARNRFQELPAAIYAMSKWLLQLSLDEQDTSLHMEPLIIPKLSVLRARGCQAKLPDLQSKNERSNLNTVFWANNGLRDFSTSSDVFRSVRLLDLAHNMLESIQDLCASPLRHLRDLSLAGNRLRRIPEALATSFPALQQLWLHGNLLETLPESLGDLQSLAILELHHNKLIALPDSLQKLRKLNWFFAHGNALSDAQIIKTLKNLPRLKIVGLGSNELPLHGLEFSGFVAFGLAWNLGISQHVLSESLTTTELHWDPLDENELQELLILTFSAQGAPVAQGQAEVTALREQLSVDALYVCDPANAWFLQDPSKSWQGLRYFEEKISKITRRYRRVFAWGGSMGGSAALLFSHLVDRVHAFSPQVDLVPRINVIAVQHTHLIVFN